MSFRPNEARGEIFPTAAVHCALCIAFGFFHRGLLFLSGFRSGFGSGVGLVLFALLAFEHGVSQPKTK